MTPPPFETLQPVREHRWESGADGHVTIFVPRFTSRWARRWVLPLFRQPDVTLRLDDIGSFVWLGCDGSTTVQQLAERAAQRFGGDLEQMLPRVVRFLYELSRSSSVTYLAPVGPAGTGPADARRKES